MDTMPIEMTTASATVKDSPNALIVRRTSSITGGVPIRNTAIPVSRVTVRFWPSEGTGERHPTPISRRSAAGCVPTGSPRWGSHGSGSSNNRSGAAFVRRPTRAERLGASIMTTVAVNLGVLSACADSSVTYATSAWAPSRTTLSDCKLQSLGSLVASPPRASPFDSTRPWPWRAY
jgi:hypothetical protein